MVVVVVVVVVVELVDVGADVAVVDGTAVVVGEVVVGADVSLTAPSVSLHPPAAKATNTSIKNILIWGRLMHVQFAYTSCTHEGGRLVSDNEDNDQSGQRIAGGAILGTGLGAAVGSIAGDLGTGIWIGAVIGVGAAFGWNASGR